MENWVINTSAVKQVKLLVFKMLKFNGFVFENFRVLNRFWVDLLN
jgi:hypothetical protein